MENKNVKYIQIKIIYYKYIQNNNYTIYVVNYAHSIGESYHTTLS